MTCESDDKPEVKKCGDKLVEADKRLYPASERSKPTWLKDYVKKVADSSDNIDFCYRVGVFIPSTFGQARNCGESIHWKRPMDDEVESLVDNGTFKLTSLPEGRKCLGGKWVFTVKHGTCENEIKYKTRYVAKGFSQVENIDYKEIFSPTAQMDSLRMLVQSSVDQDMVLLFPIHPKKGI